MARILRQAGIRRPVNEDIIFAYPGTIQNIFLSDKPIQLGYGVLKHLYRAADNIRAGHVGTGVFNALTGGTLLPNFS